MSTTLEYTTTEPVPEPIAAQIVEAARSLLPSRDWWAEPLSVAQNKQSKKLVGSTRLFLGDYSLPDGGYATVSEDEEYLLVCADAKFIVACLSEWSTEFNVPWRLGMDGHDVGDIIGGKPSTRLTELLDGLCSMSKLPPSDVPELLKKHAARKR